MAPHDDLLAARWESRHPGFGVGDGPGGVLGGWLRLVWKLARPLAAAGVSPDVVTAGGALAAVGAAFAPPGARGPLLVTGAVADGLDGAVAVLADRHSSYGAALDHAADRVADTAAAAVLVRAGAPWGVVAPGLAMSVVLEFGRGRTAPVVTVGERPTRVVCAALGDVASALTRRRWPAVVAAVVWDALAAIALVQVAARPPAHRPEPPRVSGDIGR